MSTPPTTTKAWTHSARGPLRSVLSLNPSHPLPPFPPPDQSQEWLLLRVAYAALNPGDIIGITLMPALIRSGPARTAAVPGFDLTGVVEDVWTPSSSQDQHAPTQSRFQKGDRVIAFPPFDHKRTHGVGALQGLVPIPAKYAVRLPEGKSLRDGAGLMLAGCVALQQVDETGLRQGQRVLVNGASGGIGTAAVQIARETVGREGFVVAVCSGRNVEMVRGLGADEVLDYTEYKDLAEELGRRYGGEKFDVVLDTYGSQALFNGCAGFLKEEGVYDAASIGYEGYGFWALLMSGLTLLWNGV
ncbi:putative dehydrogenase, partial [Podospora aff. communis PSN243]